MVVEPATVTPEQLAELKARAARADENWDRLLRTSADFDNFKKRAAREKQEAVKYANEGLLQKLVPVLDSLDMALGGGSKRRARRHASRCKRVSAWSASNSKPCSQKRAWKSWMRSANRSTRTSMKPFRNRKHRSVPEGHVVQQLRKGYKLRDRLLRPASVVVAKQPTA